jgi:hypothetical protein
MDVKPLGHDPAQAGFLALGLLGAGHGGLVEHGLLGDGVLAAAQAFAEQRAHVGGADGGDGLDAVVGLRGA